ncbi:MAG: SIR2 family NAD-dependent protein deacylase [Woeseiaceae bacterium]
MKTVEAAAAAVRDARHVFVLTGSGVSAESGVPTFRDAQSGLWAKYNPLELATPEAFLNDPALVWRWYRWRRELVAQSKPNPGHLALVRLSGLVPELTLVTQNVDGLHQKAGSPDVIEFHGNLFENRCMNENIIVRESDDSGDVPHCPHCHGLLRPGVVWFGEAIPATAMEAAISASRRCDVFLSIGTSSTVWPAAGLAENAASNGAAVIEINLEATPLSADSHYSLLGKSGEVLPELLDYLPL